MASPLFKPFPAVAGFPRDGIIGGAPRHGRGVIGNKTMSLAGHDQLDRALIGAMAGMPGTLRLGLREAGLIGERVTKFHTPALFGVLRATIGHFERRVPGPQPPMPGDESAAEAAARVRVEATRLVDHNPSNAGFFVGQSSSQIWMVSWGTNIHYAPWIEEGFTQRDRRLVYIYRVGFRWVAPHSYRGARMFEHGLIAARKALPLILTNTFVSRFSQLPGWGR